ncbi:MAG: PKD domain-containing protein [Bacteroidia bacterium]
MKQRYFMSMLVLLLTLFSGLKIQAQVTASATPTTGCRPLPVNFTGSATGGVTWHWDFGDGSSSNLQNPSHTFVKGGYYQVDFSAYNNTGGFIGNQWVYVNVGGVQDSLNFNSGSGGNVAVCPNDMISTSFYAGSGTTVNSVTWNFGDGYTTSNNYSSTQHTYASTGTYTVSAIVKTNCGIDTAHGLVHVVSNAPINNPYYSRQSDSICPNDAATFYTDWSYQNYVFDFGDGTVITHTNNPNNNNTQVTHVYSTIGTYPIKLTYFNSCGNTAVKLDTMHVVTHSLVTGYFSIDVNYGYHRDTACVNSLVQFYPNSNGFHSYKWNFGGGASDTSTQQSPTHQFTATGKFVVTLTVYNGCGNSKSVTDTVKIVNNLPFGSLTSTMTPDTICPGASFLYNASSNNNSYNDPSVTYVWNFSDGTANSLGNQGSHVLSNAGDYLVKCVGQNGCGSKDSVSQNVDVATGVFPNKSNYRYMSTASGRAGCIGDSVLFIFAPAGGGTVHWDFGDATNATATQDFIFQGTDYRYVKHAYTTNSHYIATVTYTNTCGNAFHDTIGVNIQPNVTDFGSGNGNIIVYDNTQYPCQGSPIAFYALEGSTYVWNFGDGTGNLVTHQTLSPVYHTFANPGHYQVTVRAYNGCGASGVDSASVNIPASLIKITTNSVSSHCTKSDGKAIAVVSGGTAPYTYQWSNGKNKYIDDSIPSGIYVVTITDLHGCSNFKIATVSDQQAPTITVGTVVNVSCYGGNDGAIAINLIGGSSPFTFHWSTGATVQSINNLVAGPKEITVKDAAGCTSSKSINVTEPPPVQVTVETHPATCGMSNGTATAAVSGTTGPYNYNWSNSGSTATITGLAPGSYSVTVVDNNGCLFNASSTVSNLNGPLIYTDSITGTGCGSALTKIYTHAVAGTAPYTIPGLQEPPLPI